MKGELETGRKKWAVPSSPSLPSPSPTPSSSLPSLSTPAKNEEVLPYSFIEAELAHAKQQLQELYNVVSVHNILYIKG